MRFTVKQARNMADKTQKEMAEMLGVSRSTYMGIEKNPEKATVGQAKRISQITGVPMDDIFFTQIST